MSTRAYPPTMTTLTTRASSGISSVSTVKARSKSLEPEPPAVLPLEQLSEALSDVTDESLPTSQQPPSTPYQEYLKKSTYDFDRVQRFQGEAPTEGPISGTDRARVYPKSTAIDPGARRCGRSCFRYRSRWPRNLLSKT